MPIRSIKPRSDRGSLKDIVNGDVTYEPPSEEELRLKKLYEFAEATHNDQLKNGLGFIVMPNAGDRNSFPISIYRHREYVNSLSQELADKIAKTKQELIECFGVEFREHIYARKAKLKQEIVRNAVLSDSAIIKTASANAISIIKRSFRRIIK